MAGLRIRLFAIQREIAGAREVELDLDDGATVEEAWAALVRLYPTLAPGRPYVRFALDGDYADPATPLGKARELAVIPPVSGGDAGRRARILEVRAEPFTTAIIAELGDRLATDEDGAVVGFVGRTRISPGTPAPGQEAEAARHAGREVQALEYEAYEPMVLAMLERIADEIEERFGVRQVAIVHRSGDVPLGEASVAVVAVSPHRDAAFRAARYAIDETKARAPIWKAEQFADGHVWIGDPARTAAPGEADDPTPGEASQNAEEDSRR